MSHPELFFSKESDLPAVGAGDALNLTRLPRKRPFTARLALAIHVLAGFVFAIVDTDQFLSELNPFTLDSVFGEDLVCRVYNWGFTLYLGYLAIRYARLAHRRWWAPAAIGLAAYASWGLLRLFWDGHIFSLYTSSDIRSVLLIGVVAAILVNRYSWERWLLPFACGAGAAFLFRGNYHFLSPQQDTIALIGVDTLGFYGAFAIHCALVFGVATIASIWFFEQRRWKWMLCSSCVALLFLAVVASGFRRTSIIESLLVPFVALLLAYWMRRQTLRGIFISLGLIAIAAFGVSAVAVGFYGLEPASERLLSLINPTDKSASMESNLSYLDDWEVFNEILQAKPLGVGYGNSYGIPRYLESVLGSSGLSDYEPPLHVGPLDLVARTGPFGALALIGLVWTTLHTVVWLRGRASQGEAMVAGCGAAFFLVVVLFPGAPSIGQVKLTATQGIALGMVLHVAARRYARGAIQRGTPEPSPDIAAPSGDLLFASDSQPSFPSRAAEWNR